MARRARAAPFPSREELLRYIEENPERASKREIARAFAIKGDDRVRLKEALRGLIDEGALERRKGRRLADPNRLPGVAPVEIVDVDVDGELWGRPIQWSGDGEPPRILVVPDRRRTRTPALGVGDRILARLQETGERAYEARIMRIIGKGPDYVVGVFDMVGGQGRIHPADRSGRDLAVAGPDGAGARPGDLVHAEVLPTRRLGLRQGRVIERFGSEDDPRALSLIAILEHDIPTRFSAESLEIAEAAAVPPLGKRTDLRDVPLITIDPEDARDFDDAVWAEPDDDPANPGGWRLLIAIADVAHYVRANSALDRDALKRGNSVYFPDRVVPMLPEALSSGVCSLRPGEERACMAVRVRIDAEGRKLDHTFVRGLMRSAARLTYRQAQDAHEGRLGELSAALVEATIAPLYRAHDALTRARDTRGPLELELPERVIRLDDEGRVAAVEPRQVLRSHRLIEDFMILANVCAAETLEAKQVPCMYRIHDEPDREKLASLRDFLKTLDLPLARGQVLKPALFNAILRKAKGEAHEHLVHQVVLRSQAQAVYSPDNIGHFGLALSRYAHFTSPIRRYADLLVHRGLITAGKLGGDGLPRGGPGDLRDIGERISKAERRAMAAEREAVDRFTALYLAERVGATFEGRISGVSRFGLFVTLSESGADGLVPMRTLGDEFFVHDEERHALIGERTGASWRLGDPVTVKLVEADPIGGRLRLDMVSTAPARGSARRRPTRGKRSPLGSRRSTAKRRRG